MNQDLHNCAEITESLKSCLIKIISHFKEYLIREKIKVLLNKKYSIEHLEGEAKYYML